MGVLTVARETLRFLNQKRNHELALRTLFKLGTTAAGLQQLRVLFCMREIFMIGVVRTLLINPEICAQNDGKRGTVHEAVADLDRLNLYL